MRARNLLAKHHLGPAFQHAARGLRQLQRAKGLAVGLKMAHGHKLAQRGAPLLFMQLAVSARPTSASSLAIETRLNASEPEDSSIMRRCCTISVRPYAIQALDGLPSRPARPVS